MQGMSANSLDAVSDRDFVGKLVSLWDNFRAWFVTL